MKKKAIVIWLLIAVLTLGTVSFAYAQAALPGTTSTSTSSGSRPVTCGKCGTHYWITTTITTTYSYDTGHFTTKTTETGTCPNCTLYASLVLAGRAEVLYTMDPYGHAVR